MSLSLIGLDDKPRPCSISFFVGCENKFFQLAASLPWGQIAEQALPDLKKTKKGFWWLGRRLNVRIHLSVFILQALLKETDRGIEERINTTPELQLFCGYGVIPNWKCPDHTKIEEFRNRLGPDTQKNIGSTILKMACELGFADPNWMDLDSTVQEAGMSYPADCTLMRKLAEKAYQVFGWLEKNTEKYFPEGITFDLAKISKLAKDYYFLAKNTKMEVRTEAFKKLHGKVKREIGPLIDHVLKIPHQALRGFPWFIKKKIKFLQEEAWSYILDVEYFIRNQSIKKGKRLAFHLKEVICINKEKVGQGLQFGRVFQLGRIGGNFLVPFFCTSTEMKDKESIGPILEEYGEIFGEGTLESFGADKGYYSAKNKKLIQEKSIDPIGLQKPGIPLSSLTPEAIVLRDRRAGIEPLIGHAKNFGLRKSRARSDTATLASGYRSVLGFNLHQFTKNLMKSIG